VSERICFSVENENDTRGNSKTCICACISPSASNYDETYSTLLFAQRAMAVRINAKRNESVFVKFEDSRGSNANLETQRLRNELDIMKRQLEEQTLRVSVSHCFWFLLLIIIISSFAVIEDVFYDV
jgi:hypothetical protein